MHGSHARPAAALTEHAGQLVFRARNVAAPIALVMLVVLTRRQDFLAPPALDGWLDAAGMVAVAVGLALRLWVMSTSGVRRSGVHRRVEAPKLYADGAYGWTRNPLYLGNATILAGLALIYDSRWLVLVGLPIAYVSIACLVATEERVLLRAFGQRYRDYCRTVPRFVPRRPPSPRSTAPDWRRGLRKEHGPIFAAVSALLALVACEHHSRFGAYGAHRTAALLLAWSCAAAGWTAVRGLKRAGLLGDAVPTRLAAERSRHVA